MLPDDRDTTFKRVRDVMEQDFDFLVELRDLADDESTDRSIALSKPKYDRQTIRRLYIRTLVSLIEAMLATLKQDALRAGGSLSDAEKLLLREETFDLNDKGEAFERPFIAPLPKSVKFAIRCFAKTHGLSRLPDYSGGGWRDFQELVRIRNRLTHPKDALALEVTDEEMATADRAEFWFLRANTDLLEEKGDKLTAAIEKLNKRVLPTESEPEGGGHAG